MAKAYNTAKEKYAAFGVDTEKVLKILDSIPLSMHCWQGDDVGGFESPDSSLSGGGIQSVYLRRAVIWQCSRFVPNLSLDKKRRKAYNAYVKSRKFELPKRFGACGGRDIECLKSMSRKTSLWMPL